MADATKDRGGEEIRLPDPPLPKDSSLTLQEYLDMQQAIANLTRYRVLKVLVANEELSPREISEALEVESDTLSYHLSKLVDVGLIQNRKRRTTDSEGLYSYYTPTSMGRNILEYGIDELMRREEDFNDTYSS